MPHKLLKKIKAHLASNETELDNGDDWLLIKNWLMVVAQKDGGNGDPAKMKSHIALLSAPLLSNNELLHQWMEEHLDAMIGQRPDTAAHDNKVGIQGSMSVVQNMSGIIATEVGKGLGAAMQQVAKSNATQQNTGSSDDAKAYTTDQLATLLDFHRAMHI